MVPQRHIALIEEVKKRSESHQIGINKNIQMIFATRQCKNRNICFLGIQTCEFVTTLIFLY